MFLLCHDNKLRKFLFVNNKKYDQISKACLPYDELVMFRVNDAINGISERFAANNMSRC